MELKFNDKGVLEINEEPYITIECKTEEDYLKLKEKIENYDNLKQESIIKDQRIADLEAENKTAVKEFANKIITKISADISIVKDYSKVKSIIKNLLKENGIE